MTNSSRIRWNDRSRHQRIEWAEVPQVQPPGEMDHYERLQVSRRASPDVIRKAYQVLARMHHPDVAPAVERQQSEAMMKILNAAKETLLDPNRRADYDAQLESEDGRPHRI